MLHAGCTDAGHSQTFCLMPTVYIFHKTVTIIWTIKSKLPASLTRRQLSCTLIKQKLPVKSYVKMLSSNNQQAPETVSGKNCVGKDVACS